MTTIKLFLKERIKNKDYTVFCKKDYVLLFINDPSAVIEYSFANDLNEIREIKYLMIEKCKVGVCVIFGFNLDSIKQEYQEIKSMETKLLKAKKQNE